MVGVKNGRAYIASVDSRSGNNRQTRKRHTDTGKEEDGSVHGWCKAHKALNRIAHRHP